MISIEIKKGYDLDIAGKPSSSIAALTKPSRVAALPEKIPFIKPRLLVEVGDRVKIGTPLYKDKHNTDLKFLSPGSGKITEINFGHRRVIKEIVIELDDNAQYEEFERIDVESIERKKLVHILMNGGLWPLIKELPFRKIADPEYIPPALWISMDGKDPFQPAPDIYLKENRDFLTLGLKMLAILCGKINITICRENLSASDTLQDIITHTYTGNFPADDPGVLIYHTKKSADENRSWYMTGQDVLLIGSFLSRGIYPVERVVACSDLSTGKIKHFNTRIGFPVVSLFPGNSLDQSARYISGGIFRGYPVAKESYLGMYETSLCMIPAGEEGVFFGFLRPGLHSASYSRTYLSSFLKTESEMDSSLHGEERACVNCGTCAKICPVDILPQFTFKSLEADEIEDALNHGLLDCVECGLCAYACPSKIELVEKLKKGRFEYYKENMS